MKHIVLCYAALFGAIVTSSADNLVIKGSDTLGAKLVPQLAEQFKADHPGTAFDIAAEGSTTGFAALIDKTAVLAMSSRPAKPEELAMGSSKDVQLKETTVAYDGIAVIVNAANPVKALTRKQVEQIFTGEITDWSAVGGTGGKISIYTRNTSSGTYAEFREMAMKKRDYAPSSQKLAGNEQIAQEVGNNPNGVGYVGLAYAQARGVKVLPIDGATPSKESVLGKSYPYARPTFYYTDGEPAGVVKEFIDFTLSDEGQKIVEQAGFVPIK
ncbi:MAG: phosphate ABC transporter substrate-binding protein [Chthoniobacterales bacterium]|nr:phosphate ABC transporter substrate-binding protein [Chthoniobacterales bacterium]